MIKKISSQELNDVMEKANQTLKDVNSKFDSSKKDLEAKMKVMSYESEYVSHLLEKMSNGSYIKEKGLIAFAKYPAKNFEKYGSTIHSKMVKTPINVFNLQMSGLGESFFREDVKVAINNKYSDDYLSFLKDDSILKPVFFDTYKDKALTIKIELEDTSMMLGPTRFNMIEIDPFLYGSFNINEMRIYVFDEDGNPNTKDEPIRLYGINNVGKERLVFAKKINFYKIEFDISINYQTNRNASEAFPFGLKHIYFYDVDFRKDSFIIAEITSSSNISFVKNDIIVKTPYGDRMSTINDEGIELYLDYNEDTLSSQIEASTTDNIKEIARNVKRIYAKIPLTTSSIITGIQFDVIDRND